MTGCDAKCRKIPGAAHPARARLEFNSSSPHEQPPTFIVGIVCGFQNGVRSAKMEQRAKPRGTQAE